MVMELYASSAELRISNICTQVSLRNACATLVTAVLLLSLLLPLAPCLLQRPHLSLHYYSYWGYTTTTLLSLQILQLLLLHGT
jgi:hypothetical protein